MSRALAERLEANGIDDPRVLAAFAAVDRARFLPDSEADYADDDDALSLGHGAMSSLPSDLGRMLELAQVEPDMRVLELGAGTGYLTALLIALGAEVFSVELSPALARIHARLHGSPLHVGDAHEGWLAHAPYDLVLASAGVSSVPEAWLAQLAPSGRIVAPVGARYQRLVRRDASGNERVDQPVDFASLRRPR